MSSIPQQPLGSPALPGGLFHPITVKREEAVGAAAAGYLSPDLSSHSAPRQTETFAHVTHHVELTLHTSEVDIIASFISLPDDPIHALCKRVFSLWLPTRDVQAINSRLATRGKFLALCAPISDGFHPVLIARPQPKARTAEELKSTLPPCWAAYLLAAHERLFAAARLEALADGGFGMRVAPASVEAHAELSALVVADGLRLLEGDIPRVVGTLAMAGGGAMSTWPQAKQALSRELGDLVGHAVGVYDAPSGDAALCCIARATLRATALDVESLPTRALSFTVRWTSAGAEPPRTRRAQAGTRTTRAARLAALLP